MVGGPISPSAYLPSSLPSTAASSTRTSPNVSTAGVIEQVGALVNGPARSSRDDSTHPAAGQESFFQAIEDGINAALHDGGPGHSAAPQGTPSFRVGGGANLAHVLANGIPRAE